MGVQLRFGAAIFAAALLGAGASPAAAQKSADTLRITMRDALPNIDHTFPERDHCAERSFGPLPRAGAW